MSHPVPDGGWDGEGMSLRSVFDSVGRFAIARPWWAVGFAALVVVGLLLEVRA